MSGIYGGSYLPFDIWLSIYYIRKFKRY